jgi:GT2 family glycosyltransferase
MQPQATSTSSPLASPLRGTKDSLKTAVILLNWRRPDLTLACLASLSALEGSLPDVYVVDNHSGDDSVPRLREALNQLATDQPHRFRAVSHRPLTKIKAKLGDHHPALLSLIESTQNLGFGGGVNLGIRAALENPEIRLIWVLNNDTVVRPDALYALQKDFIGDSRLGVLGSCLCYLEKPEIIQGVGGRYNPWLGTTRHVLGGHLYSEVIASLNRPPIDYAIGAAICIRREVLQDAGLFPENYFLYFEDVDWSFRVRKRTSDWKIGYCLESVVFHHEGASTGASNAGNRRTTTLADYYSQINRLRLARRWHPLRYPLIHLSQLLVVANRLRRRQWHLSVIALGLFIGWIPKSFTSKISNEGSLIPGANQVMKDKEHEV